MTDSTQGNSHQVIKQTSHQKLCQLEGSGMIDLK